MAFLPISKEDMKERGIEQLDFVFVIGDAYVDHPSFGHAIISRVLEANGYTVGIISQPDWKDDESINVLGEPRLAFLVMGGNMDSMVNHYYVSKKRRDSDAYTPGGVIGKRPDHAVVAYCNLIRRTNKTKPIIIGGIEASLRRMAHYDYWSNSFKRSILLDSQANLLTYGMGEKCIVQIADALASGMDVTDITYIPGTVFKTKNIELAYDPIILPSYDAMKEDKLEYANSFRVQSENTDPFNGKTLVEPYPNGVYVVQNPPQEPLTRQEMDDIYDLPYERTYHPSYEALGGIPAIQEVQFSLASCRGCFGACSFCAITFHQGRIIQSRSHESIINEAKKIIDMPNFKGYIHDVGGPTANFYHPSCKKQLKSGVCKHKQCLFPHPCKNLNVDHKDYLSLLRKLRELPKVKKVFVRSGIRFDYIMEDKDDTFFKELVKYHISGQLKVAPEHISDKVLSYMGKPQNCVYESFITKYKKLNEKEGKNQFVVPYLMSSHPGSDMTEAVKLAEYLRDIGYNPQQVQDFYPTPSTMSTVMYYTGVDPRTMKPVYVPKNPHEKAMQRALMQYRNPANYDLVKEALHIAGREDLIGFGKECLIKPRQFKYEKNYGGNGVKGNGKSKDSRKDARDKNFAGKDSSNNKNGRGKNFADKDNRGGKNSVNNKNARSGKNFANDKNARGGKVQTGNSRNGKVQSGNSCNGKVQSGNVHNGKSGRKSSKRR